MNEQEEFWKGAFGTEYTSRNRVDWKSRGAFWRMILKMTQAESILEVGCNAGWNLLALRDENAALALRGVDLSHDAVVEAADYGFAVQEVGACEVGVLWPERFDLVFTAGVLIHVGPTHMEPTLKSIAAASKKYVLAVEYGWPTPTEIMYRGHSNRLWKRPFGALYEKIGLKLVATGELTQEQHGFDNCTFWLLQK